jgi:hypothetical protein
VRLDIGEDSQLFEQPPTVDCAAGSRHADDDASRIRAFIHSKIRFTPMF